MPAKNPKPAFQFTVEWGGQRVGFCEVSGLPQKSKAIESRDASFLKHTSTKVPGLRKFSNITLKRGIVRANNEFFNWLSMGRQRAVESRDLVISLLNEQQRPIMVWKVHNALPVKVEAPSLQAKGNEVAIESIELAHEGFELQEAQ